MLIAFPFSRRDQALALANLQWMAQLGCGRNHDILLFVDDDVDFTKELEAAKRGFKTADAIQIDKPTTTRWPISQNHVWKRIVDYIDYKKLYPFFLQESDAIVLTRDGFDRFEVDYRKSGQVFMGYLEYSEDLERRHMNGVGMYGDIYKEAPLLMSAPTDDNGTNYLAFDWAGGREVVPKMHVTRLIQFQYKQEDKLLADETLSWLNPDAVIFHTCKNVRIFDLLRKRNGGDAKLNHACVTQARPAQAVVKLNAPTTFQPESALTCDIFIKTYDKVADWHAFAMRSIDRFCIGFRRTVVIGQQPEEGYQQMQIHKLNADLYTDADYILTTDSDVIFSLDVTPATYMRDGKTIWLHRTWKNAIEVEGQEGMDKWHRGMKRFFGIEPPYEFMCRHPEMIPRWLYSAFRIFCFERHGKTMAQWVAEDKEFADWNMLGMYAWIYHHEAFFWINQSEVEPPPVTVKQYWGGHTAIAPHIPEMEAILAGGVRVEHKPPGPIDRALKMMAELPPPKPPKTFWESHQESNGKFPAGAGNVTFEHPKKKRMKRKKAKRVITAAGREGLRRGAQKAREAKARKAMA